MAGDKPWLEVPVGNKDHNSAAVVIIGAGLSGICTAIDLIKRNNCRNFVILEKSASLGGTWNDNKYPGCGCDVPSVLYSYSFAKNPDWSRVYSSQEEILAYLIGVAQEYNLYQHLRFNSTVEEAKWNDAEKKWCISVATAQGSKEAGAIPQYDISTDFLVSGVGQLNYPKWPDIPGLGEFAGKTMHSARWDWSYDLEGKTIALLGNGCSAVQILPEIAKVAKHVTVFQRTPNWVVPKMDGPISNFMRGIFRYVPGVMARVRAMQMDFREWHYGLIADKDSDVTQVYYGLNKQMLESQFPNQPDVWEKLTPKFALGCKRIIISDDYFPAIARENVSLETRPIDRISGKRIEVRKDNGNEKEEDKDIEYDLLVCATGFQTLDFMHPIEMYGAGGRSLRDMWNKGAQAFNGITVQQFPNFGMLYGPNTNLGHNSIILMIESQSRYINGLIKPVLEARRAGKSLSITPKPDRLEAYNARIQRELQSSTFNDPRCNSWYKNEQGLITNNWSRTVVEYQKMVEIVDFDDYEIEGTGRDVMVEQKALRVGRVHEETTFSDRALIAMGVLASTAVIVSGIVIRHPKLLHSIRLR